MQSRDFRLHSKVAFNPRMNDHLSRKGLHLDQIIEIFDPLIELKSLLKKGSNIYSGGWSIYYTGCVISRIKSQTLCPRICVLVSAGALPEGTERVGGTPTMAGGIRALLSTGR